MNPYHRLHELRMENDAARYAQQEQAPRFQTMKNRHENGTAPRAVVAYQLFQTPPELAARVIAAAGVQAGDRVLEPSAGLGRLIDCLPRCVKVAIEIAPQCAAELFTQEREDLTLLQRDFLTVQPEEVGTFDAVVMNPPFHMRADVKHILHARKFVKSGGTLAAMFGYP